MHVETWSAKKRVIIQLCNKSIDKLRYVKNRMYRMQSHERSWVHVDRKFEHIHDHDLFKLQIQEWEKQWFNHKHQLSKMILEPRFLREQQIFLHQKTTIIRAKQWISMPCKLGWIMLRVHVVNEGE